MTVVLAMKLCRQLNDTTALYTDALAAPSGLIVCYVKQHPTVLTAENLLKPS